MTDGPQSMMAIHGYLGGELDLSKAANLLRKRANSGGVESGTLGLDTLPEEQRQKAEELFNESIQPICRGFMNGEIDTEAAARQLAPLVFPIGVFALNFAMPSGPEAHATMARFGELVARLAKLEGEAGHRD